MSRDAFTHAVLSQPLYEPDAAVVLTGDGMTRLGAAFTLFAQGACGWIVISGGLDDPPYSLMADKMGGALIGKGVDPERIIVDNDSKNTRESAECVVDVAVERDWHRILLVTSSYHLPRALLTFVQVLNERDLAESIHVVPMASPAIKTDGSKGPSSGLFEVPPGLDVRRIDLLDGESVKVARYQLKGDVASYEDGLAYLEHWEANA